MEVLQIHSVTLSHQPTVLGQPFISDHKGQLVVPRLCGSSHRNQYLALLVMSRYTDDTFNSHRLRMNYMSKYMSHMCLRN